MGVSADAYVGRLCGGLCSNVWVLTDGRELVLVGVWTRTVTCGWWVWVWAPLGSLVVHLGRREEVLLGREVHEWVVRSAGLVRGGGGRAVACVVLGTYLASEWVWVSAEVCIW